MWRWDQQEPFGVNVPDENPSGLGAFEFPMRFAGTYADRETALLYNWHRYRDLTTGRFAQTDPLGLDGNELSLYVLSKNNPLTFTDPFGLMGQGGAGVVNQWKPTWGLKGPDPCPIPACRNPVTVSWNGVCRADDVMCGQAMKAAGIQGPYYPETKTYSLDCLLKFGIGVKATGSVGSTIVANRIGGLVAILANNPGTVAFSVAKSADSVFKYCECKDE